MFLRQVLFYGADGSSKSSFYPFSGVTEELKAFLHDVSVKVVGNFHAIFNSNKMSFASSIMFGFGTSNLILPLFFVAEGDCLRARTSMLIHRRS